MITQNDIQRLFGMDVYEADGSKIGSTAQVYLDNRTGNPEWVSVKTGLFGTKETFVPLERATLSEDRIVVPFGKDQVKNAPQIDPDGNLSPAEEDELYRYYGLTSSEGNLTGDDTATVGTDTGTRTSTTDTDTRTSTTDTDTRMSTTDTDTDRATERRTGDDDRAYAGTTGTRDTGGTAGFANDDRNDTSGPTTDDAMTRSEERLIAGKHTEEAGRARLRKYVVTEQQQVSVPVSREEVRIEREPITDANRDAAMDGPDISEEEHEVTLHAERPVVDTETVPVERVRLGKETVTDTENVQGEVRKEQIEYDGPEGRDRA
jgi:uncharacterized protein (TIGR02271 family)